MSERYHCQSCGAAIALADVNVATAIALWQRNGAPQQVIQVECQANSLKFGTTIPDDQKAFIAEALRRSIAED